MTRNGRFWTKTLVQPEQVQELTFSPSLPEKRQVCLYINVIFYHIFGEIFCIKPRTVIIYLPLNMHI